jgi:hypothetical protein
MCALQRLLGAGLIVALALTVAGCHRKKPDAPPPPEEPKGNPLKPDPAGGGGARNDVQRGAQRMVNQNLMRNMGQFFVAYKSDHEDRPPRTAAEFKAYLQADPNASNEAAALDKGWVELVLDPPPTGHQVLAYEKDVYQKWNNRLVLFADGSVEMMLDPDFQKALKGQ